MNLDIQIALFFLLNLILSIGSIIGVVSWAESTKLINYEYYLFCSIINLVFVLFGFCFYDIRNENELENELSPQESNTQTLRNKRCYDISVCISFCYSIMWIFAALTSTLHVINCKNNGTCTGLIISVIFGYLLFILWSLFFFITIIYSGKCLCNRIRHVR